MGRISMRAAVAYATEMHKGQLRVGGLPYVTHPIAVRQIVKRWGCSTIFWKTRAPPRLISLRIAIVVCCKLCAF